jgi:flagellar hook assembly protein FlgD
MSASRVIIACLLLFSSACAFAQPIQPVIGNIDRASIADEIVTTSFDGNLYAWKSDRTLLDGNWPVKFDGFVCASSALVDLDSDPKDLEILVPVCDRAGKYKLYGLQSGGNIISGWIKELEFPVHSGPVIGEFKISGKKSKIIFIGGQDGKVYAFDLFSWQPLKGWMGDLGGGKAVSVSVFDIDKDGEHEVITTSGGGRITITDHSAGEWSILSDINIGSGIACQAVCSDIDRDGKPELLAASADGTLYVWKFFGGRLSPLWSIPFARSIISPPIVGNLDADKELEIVCVSSDNKVQVINNDGTLLSGEVSRAGSSVVGSRGFVFPGAIGNMMFFIQFGSHVSNVYCDNPKFTVTEWGMFHHQRQPCVLDLSAFPDPFSPNGDGRKDYTAITSQVDSPVPLKGDLKIYSTDARLVKNIKEGDLRGFQQLSWDGRGEQGYNGNTVASSDSYAILLNVESEMSDRISQLGTVVVDNIPPSFEMFSVTPETLIEDSEFSFRFYPSEPSQLTIVLLGQNGDVYKSYFEFLETIENTTEAYEFLWDGRGTYNQLLPGTYAYVASLEDTAGNFAVPKTGKLTIAVEAPFLNGVYATPEVFSTKSDQNRTKINYALLGDASVKVSVLDTKGKPVKTLFEGAIISGSHFSEWDGSSASGSFEPDGSYKIGVEALEPSGAVSTGETFVVIDSTPPSLVQVQVLPQQFSPQASFANTSVSFFLSERADLAVDVFDGSGNMVRHLTDEAFSPSGYHQYFWDGKDQSGSAVSDGSYKFRITASDIARNTRVSEAGVLAASAPPSIASALADPDLFTPNSGRSNSWTKISYTLSGGIGSVSVSLNILDASGGTVKRLLKDELTSAGNYCEIWYGDVETPGGLSDLNGDGFADSGEYIFEIIATDAKGNQARAEGPLSVAGNPNLSVWVSPLIFSPPKGESTIIHYNVDYSDQLSGNAEVWIDIYDAGGQKIYNFADSVSRGSYTHVWGGESIPSGAIVPDGTYRVKVHAKDPLSNDMILYSGSVIVDSNGPAITVNGASPNPFTPNMFERSFIDFTVNDPASAVYLDPIRIYDPSGALVKTIQHGDICWDGSVDGVVSDLNGDSLADEGTYSFFLRATDEAGNESGASGNIVVDRAVLSLNKPVGVSALPVHFSPVIFPSTAIDFVLAKTAPMSISQPVGYISVEVSTSGETLVRTLVPSVTDSGRRAAGAYGISWDGKDQSGLIAKDGEYKIVVRAFDFFNNPAEGESNLTYDVIVDSTPPSGSIVVNGGKRATKERDASLSLHAEDALSDVVLMSLDNDDVFDSFPQSDFIASMPWVLPEGDDGERAVYVKFMDSAGNWSGAASDSIILDRKPPVISSISANPSPFSPGGSPGAKDSSSIKFTLDEPVSLSIQLNNGSFVAAGLSIEAGANSFSWSPGASIPEGTYAYTIFATDEAGNSSQTTGVDSISVDNTPPNIIFTLTSPNPVNQLCETFQVNYGLYDLSQDILLEAKILRSSGDIVKTLRTFFDLPFSSGDGKQIFWDGKNELGNYVNEGSYKVRIKAKDPAGNTTQFLYISFEAQDDQRMTFTTLESQSPSLTIEGNTMKLEWGGGAFDRAAQTSVHVETSFRPIGRDLGGGEGRYEDEQSFTIDFPQTISLAMSCYLEYVTSTAGEAVFVLKDCTGKTVFSRNFVNSDHNERFNSGASIALVPGIYKLYLLLIDRRDAHSAERRGYADLSASFLDRKYSVYSRTSSGNYPLNWSETIGPISEVDDLSAGPKLLSEDLFTEYLFSEEPNGKHDVGTITHKVYMENKEIYYKRGEVVDQIEKEYSAVAVTDIDVGGTNWGSWKDDKQFTIYYGQDVYLQSTGGGWGGGWTSEHSLEDLWGNVLWHAPAPGYGKTIWLTFGTYVLKIKASASAGGVDVATKAYYKYKTVTPEVEWSDPVRLTNNIASSENLSLCADANWNAYVAWQDFRDGNWEIYFQKIPLEFEPLENFKPVVKTASLSMGLMGLSDIRIAQVYTSPECISPKGGVSVQTLRPTLKWYGLKNVRDYRIECSMTSAEADLAGSMDYFNFTIPEDESLKDRPVGLFAIPDTQMGLDENSSDFNPEPYWYWRVKAISAEGVSTSEAASFSIVLPISISGVINYPNPFNPNKEKTKIRYRLGGEADSVVIRIYDITGALVVELDGETRGEGASIWDKYNDVQWDGRNGRGDTVKNGVYPFEVRVSSGDKKVSGRGKIVVLK